ncbi:MAG: hypothetical protein GY896_01805 [Gammaproteobacteria bacterium]|nr:hypothetical protein [Gammaproteobacteria bacterium]
MLKQIRKKKNNKVYVAQTETEQITCGACNHVRKETATNPKWQCPCCGAAYTKVNTGPETEQVSQQELRRKNHAYLKQKKNEESLTHATEEQTHPALTGMLIGAATFVTGLGSSSACRVVAANPVVQAVGGLIFVAALVYGVMKFLA